MTSNRILTAIALTVLTLNAYAQSNHAKYEIGAGIGGYIYQGDLTPSDAGSLKTIRPGIILHGSKILSSSFLTRTNLTFTTLKGDDALYDHPEYRQHRNFNFRTPVFELSQLIVWDPTSKNYMNRGLSPYLFAGIGMSVLNIKRDWSNFDAAYFGETSDLPARIQEDANNTPPHAIAIVPVGFGLRYAVSDRIAVNAESTYRFAFTDYIDGFSQAVNPSKGDSYHNVSVGAIYRIGKKNTLDCPVVKY